MDATDVVIENSHDKTSTIMEEISGYREKESDRELFPQSFKTAIYGTFVRRMRKDVRYCFDKNHDERLESKLE